MQHLSQLLDDPLSRAPERPAARGLDGNYTYAALDRAAEIVARGLAARDVRPNEPVVVRIGNRALDLAGFIGVWRAGGVAVPIHRTTPERVARALIERCGARFVVEAGEVLVPDTDRPVPPERPLLRGAAFVVFTSGTTGEPKGVAIRHQAFTAKLATIDRTFPFLDTTRTLLVLQLTFSFGQWVSLLTLSRGGLLVLHEKYDAERMLAALAEQRLNRIGIVPTMMRAALPGLATSAIARDGIERFFMAGGEPMAKALAREWRAALSKSDLADIYGLTETSTCDFFLPPSDLKRYAGTIGTPMPGVAFAISEGELRIKSPFIMAGYLDAPELTAAAFHGDYFRTGDLAEATETGRVRLIGRLKELILRGGNKVAPLEVERVFLDHPDVAETLATGIPDARLGEAVHLLIVPKRGRRPDAERLRDWAAERLDKYKLPDAIHFGTEIPLGRTGKADRTALRARLMAEPT
ncbi:MAG TPA: class I adenylate-forming enzyme family protein [Stellaceae bacterium]|nr:class I adenylate-forming enzyme family protein [Stellaceae bacterium]